MDPKYGIIKRQVTIMKFKLQFYGLKVIFHAYCSSSLLYHQSFCCSHTQIFTLAAVFLSSNCLHWPVKRFAPVILSVNVKIEILFFNLNDVIQTVGGAKFHETLVMKTVGRAKILHEVLHGILTVSTVFISS